MLLFAHADAHKKPLGAHNRAMLPADKTVSDEFMLKEYESIAAAHFDSQSGLRQQFRFYLIIVAVPLTVLGFALNHPIGTPPPATEIGLTRSLS
jgi:hypothetical protein